ncbi:uncharacterized protein GJ701_002322 isoform 1-T2 [Geothlypis trichas]
MAAKRSRRTKGQGRKLQILFKRQRKEMNSNNKKEKKEKGLVDDNRSGDGCEYPLFRAITMTFLILKLEDLNIKLQLALQNKEKQFSSKKDALKFYSDRDT